MLIELKFLSYVNGLQFLFTNMIELNIEQLPGSVFICTYTGLLIMDVFFTDCVKYGPLL